MDLGDGAVISWPSGCVKAAHCDMDNLRPEAAQDPQRSRDTAGTNEALAWRSSLETEAELSDPPAVVGTSNHFPHK